MNLFKNMGKEGGNAAESEAHGEHGPQQPQVEAGQAERAEGV